MEEAKKPPTMEPEPEWKADLEEFQSMCRRRMVSGMQQYGDRSFDENPVELLRELQSEAMDLHCWGFILWRVMEQMRKSLVAKFDGKVAKEIEI